jgi:hypothetical protein
MESCLAEIAARTAGSVMLSDGRSASSKNIFFQAAGHHEGQEPATFGTCRDSVPGSARHEDV